MEEIKKNMEEMKKLLHDFQDEHKRLDESGKTNSEALERMGKKFEEMSLSHQKTVEELNAEKKAREELELAVARGSSSVTPDGEIKSSPEYKQAFNKFLKGGKAIDNEVEETEFKKILSYYDLDNLDEKDYAKVKAMSVSSNPDGGYFVPVERLARISQRIFETSPMRQIASIITTGTEAVEMILDDGQFGFQTPGELDVRTVTDTSKIGLITVPVHEHSANAPVTQKLLDDAAINIDAWIQGKIADRFARAENHEFVVGTGNKECQGFLTLADWAALGVYERNALETRTTSTALDFAADDLLDLQSDLIEAYQANATWTMHRKIWVEVLKKKDNDNQYLMNPAMLFGGSLAMQLLGRPVVMFGDMPATMEEDDYIIAYGDFREGYLIVDRMGIRVLRDPYTVKSVVQFYATKRTGGGVVNFQAIKRLKVLGS